MASLGRYQWLFKLLSHESKGKPMNQTVTKRRMEAALCTLADLTAEDHEELDGATRDEFAVVIDVLDRMIEERR